MDQAAIEQSKNSILDTEDAKLSLLLAFCEVCCKPTVGTWSTLLLYLATPNEKGDSDAEILDSCKALAAYLVQKCPSSQTVPSNKILWATITVWAFSAVMNLVFALALWFDPKTTATSTQRAVMEKEVKETEEKLKENEDYLAYGSSRRSLIARGHYCELSKVL